MTAFIAGVAGLILGWMARAAREDVQDAERRLDKQVDDLLPGHPRDDEAR